MFLEKASSLTIENGKLEKSKVKEVTKKRTFVELRSELSATDNRKRFLEEANVQECWTLLINGLLTEDEQLVIYNIHHQALFESCKSRFKHFYLYCSYYQNIISESTKALFIKKLESPQNIHMLDFALKEIKFLRNCKDELVSIKMFHKFANS